MNLYSNKQRWKIVLLVIALLLVGVSLFFSNEIVKKVALRERSRAEQWADAIKKKAELVQFTNETFTRLRTQEREKMELWIDATKEVSKPIDTEFLPDYSFPLKIINKNTDIPVILLEQNNAISATKNLDFELADIQKANTHLTANQQYKIYSDSVKKLAKLWRQKNPPFTIEVYRGLFMTYIYNDSREISRLESDRDSLFNAFNKELIQNSGMLPVLLVDQEADTIVSTNIEITKQGDQSYVKTKQRLSSINKPIELIFSEKQNLLLYYDNSAELKQLQYFPYIQFALISLFIFIGYILFSTFRKAEQNQVWVGMAKETAHQLGTPLSSLMAWIQLLESYEVDQSVVVEMQKDVDRLSVVTERFSKIGSINKLEETDIVATCKKLCDYLRIRISSKIVLEMSSEKDVILVQHNPPLMEWVLENILKNAVDAMETSGKLHLHIFQMNDFVHIDISDTGKGMDKKYFKTIFQPGYTSKKRGWGLGLSLVKRIVTEYHHGKVYVLNSEPGMGTTFRISLPKKIKP